MSAEKREGEGKSPRGWAIRGKKRSAKVRNLRGATNQLNGLRVTKDPEDIKGEEGVVLESS